MTAWRYGSLTAEATFAEMLGKLAQVCHKMLENHVIEDVLNSLARAISLK